jgi:hypothetical protein
LLLGLRFPPAVGEELVDPGVAEGPPAVVAVVWMRRMRWSRVSSPTRPSST